jgi:hypothetical protein
MKGTYCFHLRDWRSELLSGETESWLIVGKEALEAGYGVGADGTSTLNRAVLYSGKKEAIEEGGIAGLHVASPLSAHIVSP